MSKTKTSRFFGLHDFWACLNDKQLSRLAVFSPLHVHGRWLTVFGIVVGLDLTGPAGEGKALIKLISDIDWHDIAKVGFGIDGEHYSGGPKVTHCVNGHHVCMKRVQNLVCMT